MSSRRDPSVRLSTCASVLVLGLCGVLPVAQAAGLPVVCSGGSCSGQPFTTSTNPAATLPNTVGKTMTVNQVDQRQIFNWQSFNIDSGYAVNFNQADASYAALNRIWDANPSRIYGAINAPGQVFLINQNGIIFGNGAQVNVGSLVASTLNIADKDFLNPIFFSSNQGGSPAFSGGGNGYVRVEAGATLTTAKGGSIWLFAPEVSNRGTIQTEEGQVILAAGQQVYLQASDNPALRGFLVEVSSGGKAENLGDILATRGNATLVGIAVNQSGRITATTSSTLNGSIRLLARDTVTTGGDQKIVGTNTSTGGRMDQEGQPLESGVKLAADSETSVLPEIGQGESSADSQNFIQSEIDIFGRSIQVLDNAKVIAPYGIVNFTAALNASQLQFSNATATRASDVHVYFAPGSVVDVSGLQNVQLAMESNAIQVDLQGAQLADAPLQHNGFLKGAKVWVDLRQIGNGKIPLADLSGYVGQVQRTVDERSTKGGTVTVKSEGDIVTRAGSTINVSGGSVAYGSGYVKSSQLIANGRVYDIATAPADLIYNGFGDSYSETDSKWGVTRTWIMPGAQHGQYEAGYIEGKDAGSLTLQAFAYGLDGQQVANVVVGQRQRDLNQLPLLATLNIGGSSAGRAFTPDVSFATQGNTLAASYQYGDPLPNSLTLSTDALRQSGFGNVLVYSGGRIHVPNGVSLSLPEGGRTDLMGLQVAVDGNITAHGGTVNLSSKVVTPGNGQTGLTVGSDAQIDVSGLWVNDLPQIAGTAPMTPPAINGGKVNLSSQSGLDVRQGSAIDVSGGAWLDRTGRVKAGNAGAISLKANQGGEITDAIGDLVLQGDLRGGALAQGGSLTIDTFGVNIGGVPNPARGILNLDPAFFNRGGFRSFDINGQSALSVAADTAIAPMANYRLLGPGYAVLPTGSRLDQFSRLQTVPVELRSPVSLTLSADSTPRAQNNGGSLGVLTIGTGASILTDPQSTITLTASQLLDIDGTLSAPAGSITLSQAQGESRGSSVSYDANAGIWLGSHARLLARGATRILPDRYGVRSGSVLSGGSINLAAYNGYVMTDGGAVVDVSGVAGQMDKVPGTNDVLAQPVTVGGDAGSLSVYATEGLVLNAQLNGGVAVAGANPGQLSVTLESGPSLVRGTLGQNNYPVAERELVITNASGMPNAVHLGQGNGVPLAQNGLGYVSADTLRSSGFGDVALSGEDRIRFADNVKLSGFARSLTLDSPVLQADGGYAVHLAAPYVTLANTRYWRQGAGAPAMGSGSLDVVAAQNLDLVGSINLNGFATLDFQTNGDIRLIGAASNPNDLARTGQLVSNGDMQFTARQIYPTTLSDFTLRIQDNPLGTISFNRARDADGNPLADTPVLSAGGSLSIEAPNIAQDGVIKAPLGHIVLDAAEYDTAGNGLARGTEGSLILGAESVTSVSLENQTVPFGYVENGQIWKYGLADGVNKVIDAPPDKVAELKGADVQLKPGAKLNLDGGGDLYAAEFLPGPLGSRDALADPNRFAVLPAFGAQVAPMDFQYGSGSSLKTGDSIYLSGGAGLAAGYYTLLPAYYALLPGAYAVKLNNGSQPAIPGQSVRAIDGSAISAGYRYVAGTALRDAGWSNWTVMPQAVVRNLAEYHDYSANTQFGATTSDQPVAPRLPQDAGQLIFAATHSLKLQPGAVSMNAGAQGRGGLLDVDAPKIAVVDAAGNYTGYLELSADSLSNLGAASILLGGRRSAATDGMSITVGATEVVVANDAQSPLTGQEILLAGKDQVTVQDNGVITGTGSGDETAQVLHLDGPGALLRVSSGAQARVERGSHGTGAGVLTIGAKAKLSGKSLLLDATGNTAVAGNAVIDAQSVSLSSSRIALGNNLTGSGLLLTSNLLGQVAGATDLILRSYGNIDVYDGAGFDLTTRRDENGDLVARKDAAGNLLVSSLTLDAGAIVSHLSNGQGEEITAHNMTLRNSGNVAAGNGGNVGSLTLTAKRIDANTGQMALADGAQQILGFTDVTLNAGTQVRTSGSGSLNTDAANLNIIAPRLTAADKSSYVIAASGAVNLSRPADAVALPDTSSLGASLTITGDTINHLGNVVLRGGDLKLNAVHDLVLGSTTAGSSATDARGWTEAFADQTRYYPAGTVTLSSDQGAVRILSGATVDVSAAADANGSGDAGTVRIQAPVRQAQIDGSILGASASGRGGSFELDAGNLSNEQQFNAENLTAAQKAERRLLDSGALAKKLADGGFNQSIIWRARNGDITLAPYLAAADQNNPNAQRNAVALKAQTIHLEADAGNIDLAAALDASGTQGGRITLAAKQNITVRNGASLDVSATDALAKGGSIQFLSSDGTIALQSGATFKAQGPAGNGAVYLRAKRNAANTDFQVADLSATFDHVNQVMLEAYKAYTSTTGMIASTDITSWYGDAQNFMANTPAIKNRLGIAGNDLFQLAPGIEVQSSGDLTLAANTDWSLSNWRYDATTGAAVAGNTSGVNNGHPLSAGVLTLRAAGNLNLNSSLSDGFSNASTSGTLQGLNSWSYRLVAGSDAGRADPNAVVTGTGDLVLAADKLVRTGAGFIDVAAGEDVKLSSEGSVIYTAGYPAPALPGWPTIGTLKSLKFPIGGGDIRIVAGNDIIAAPESQLFNTWLNRLSWSLTNGNLSLLTRPGWLPNFSLFKQGIGALGGGNVTVQAGRDIENLGVVIPTIGRLQGATGTVPDPSNLLVQGGGNLSVSAGRNIDSGLFYVARGTGTIRAGGALGQATNREVSTLLGLGDGSFDVRARGNLRLETVVNPTLLYDANNANTPKFVTYSPDSAVNLTSLDGNVTFSDHVTSKLARTFSSIPNQAPDGQFDFYPSRLEALAFQGDIQNQGLIVLMPSSSGNLSLLAGGSISLEGTLGADGTPIANGTIQLSGANPALLPTLLAPITTIANDNIANILSPAIINAIYLPGTPLYQSGDSEPVHMVANTGDIVGDGTNISAILAKPAWIEAGRDIKNLDLRIENHQDSSVSTVRAGRDVIYTDTLDAGGNVLPGTQTLAISGPGRLDVSAGRNIDLGGSIGIVSRGNLDVANLPEKGADLYVMAGLGQSADGRVRTPDYQAFANAYFNNSPAGQQALADFFADVERQLRLNQTLSDADVQTRMADYRNSFANLALSERVSRVFFNELRQGGIQGSAGNYQRAYDAIATLFPRQDYQGNIDLFNSQIKTETGGDINLFAPGGLVNVGLAKPGNSKSPSDQGIFTVSGGVIRSFSEGDFLVNQSRVFTLQGDDVLLWSSDGNIDAGKGSKTASASPPPRLIFTKGAFVLDTTSLVSGSGIGQLLARTGYKAGIVSLIAPRGDVNAGEAGIRVAGDLLVAAQRVIGANNIQVGGISVGVPAAQSTSLGGLTGSSSLGDANRAGQDPAKSLRDQEDRQDQMKRIAQSLAGLQPSFITVDVIGFGLSGDSSGMEEEDTRKRRN